MIPWSTYELLSFCERQFYYRRVLRLPEPPSEYLEVGSIYHDAIASRLQFGDFERTPRAPELEANLDRLWAEVIPYLTPVVAENRQKTSNKIDLISSTTPVTRDGRVIGSEPGDCVIDWKVLFSAKRKLRDAGQLASYCLDTGFTNAAFVEIPRNLNLPIRTMVSKFEPGALAFWRAKFAEKEVRLAELRCKQGDNIDAYTLVDRGHPLCSSRWCPFWGTCEGGEERHAKP